MKKTILFDMDGVLVNSEPYYMDRAIKLLTQLNLPYNQQTLISCIGISDELTVKTINEMTGGRLPKNYNELLDLHYPYYQQDFSHYKMSHIDEVLDYLKEHHYQVGLCSSSYIFQIKHVLKTIQRSDYFDVVLSGEQFVETKPHPEIYLTAAKKLNVKPQDCLVIEDSYAGICAAKNANMTCVALINPLYTVDTSLADYVIHDLIELLDLIKKDV